MNYRSIRDFEEFEAAKKASNSFYIDEMEADVRQKNLFWDFQKKLDFSFVVGAFSGDDLIGLIRMIPTQMRLGDDLKNTACITSVVVKKNYRGKGISKGLMKKAISVLEEKKFDMVYLFARRAVDDYYNKFGFVGFSSFEKIIHFSLTSSENSNSIILKEQMTKERIALYNQAYDNSYKNCLGAVCRNDMYWASILDRVACTDEIEFVEVWNANIFVGYFIYKKGDRSEVLEISIDDKFLNQSLYLVIKYTIADTISIPHNHNVLEGSALVDFSISYRCCVNGGHMLKLIGERYNECPFETYKTVKSKLEEVVGKGRSIGNSLSFNFSWPDQL